MTAPADALYKQLFSHPEIVRDLVAGFLPAGWARQLEVGAFERVNASYTSDEGKARHEDVVWRATETERAAAPLNMLLARLMLPDLAPARASLQRWLLLTLRGAGGSTNIDWEEGLVMNAKRQPRFNELITEDFIRRLVQPQEEALQEGVQQGMQQGMQQGELLALQGVLRDLLAGDVPVEAAGKIAQADVGQLRAWIKSLFAGASPRQLFAEG